MIFRPRAGVARRAEKHISAPIEDKGAAILDHRPAPAITANHEGVTKAAGDIEHRPGLDDQRAVAAVDSFVSTHIESITSPVERGVSCDDGGTAREPINTHALDCVGAPKGQCAGISRGQKAPVGDVTAKGETGVGRGVYGFNGGPGHIKIDGLGDWRGRIPVESDVAAQGDGVAAQHKGSSGGIERDTGRREARKVVAVHQTCAARKSQWCRRNQRNIPVAAGAPIIVSTATRPSCGCATNNIGISHRGGGRIIVPAETITVIRCVTRTTWVIRASLVGPVVTSVHGGQVG